MWHRFGIWEAETLESGIVFELQEAKMLESDIVSKFGEFKSLKKAIVFELQEIKTLESGIVFKILGPRLPDRGNTPQRRRLTWISPSPHPITPRKKIRCKARVLTSISHFSL